MSVSLEIYDCELRIFRRFTFSKMPLEIFICAIFLLDLASHGFVRVENSRPSLGFVNVAKVTTSSPSSSLDFLTPDIKKVR